MSSQKCQKCKKVQPITSFGLKYNGEAFKRCIDCRKTERDNYNKKIAEEKKPQEQKEIDSNSKETPEHKNGKNKLALYLKTKKVIIRKECYCCQSEISTDTIDVFDSKNCSVIIEDAYNEDRKHGDVVFYKDNSILYIFEVFHTHRTKWRPGTWYEISASEILNTKPVKNTITLTCCRYLICEDCNKPGELKINQRGPGNGKTHEIAKEAIENNILFVLCVAKMRSATDEINNKIVKRGKEFEEEVKKEYKIEYVTNNRKHKIHVRNWKTENTKIISVRTIDSLFSSIVYRDQVKFTYFDIFVNIAQAIAEGYFAPFLQLQYETIPIGPGTKIYVDEAQDMLPVYGQALEQLRTVGVDIELTGDVAQCVLYGSNNALMWLIANGNVEIDSRNIVKRFHNKKLRNFCNKYLANMYKILEDEYKITIPNIQDICDGKNCNVHHEDRDPIFFNTPRIYGRDRKDPEKYIQDDNSTSDKIIKYMKNEVERYNYLPEDFMFIFPFVKPESNPFAETLVSDIGQFWADMFDNAKYKEKALKNPYWKNILESNTIPIFVYKHCSEQETCIDLSISEHCTRILSVHASKGLEANVVFFFPDDFPHKVFSGEDKLQFYSFLNVGLTRARKMMFIGKYRNGDTIDSIFSDFEGKENSVHICPSLENIRSSFPLKNIVDFSLSSHFPQLVEEFKKHKLVPKSTDIISPTTDYNFHILRYNTAMLMAFLSLVLRKNDKEPGKRCGFSQFYAIVCQCREVKFEKVASRDYRKRLNIEDIRKTKTLPILVVNSKNPVYKIYGDILIRLFERVIVRLNRLRDKQDCPLEAILLNYVLDLYSNGYFCRTSIHDIYKLLIDVNEKSACNECLKIFKENLHKDYKREELNEYFEHLQMLEQNFVKYNEQLEAQGITELVYNMEHQVSKNGAFTVYDRLPIIATNSDTVVVPILKPKYCELNYAKIAAEALFRCNILENYTVEDDEEKTTQNHERFGDKRIVIFIIPTEGKPFSRILPNTTLVKEIIEEYITNETKGYASILYDFYKYHAMKGRNPIQIYEEAKKNKKLPPCLLSFFDTASHPDVVKFYTKQSAFICEVERILKQNIHNFCFKEEIQAAIIPEDD